jgi:hypothetical protein
MVIYFFENEGEMPFIKNNVAGKTLSFDKTTNH